MSYVPERGDLVWLTFDPQAGHEQAGSWPAFVLSPAAYNGKTSLFLACPVNSRVKGYPFEIALPAGLPVNGVILADQIKSLDWKEGKALFAARTPPEIVDAVALILPLISEE